MAVTAIRSLTVVAGFSDWFISCTRRGEDRRTEFLSLQLFAAVELCWSLWKGYVATALNHKDFWHRAVAHAVSQFEYGQSMS
jgi:hypothetical protein